MKRISAGLCGSGEAPLTSLDPFRGAVQHDVTSCGQECRFPLPRTILLRGDVCAEPGRRCTSVIDPEGASRLRMVVTHLASEIGPRNVYHYRALCSAADYLESAFSKLGYHPTRQSYKAQGKRFANLIAERKGNTASEEVLVVGAHYDSHNARRK